MRIKLKSIYRQVPGESESDRMYRVIREGHQQSSFKRLLKEARGASERELLGALETLNRQVWQNGQAWTLIARYAGRVEREARKLDAKRRANVMAQQLVDRGLAVEVVRDATGV